MAILVALINFIVSTKEGGLSIWEIADDGDVYKEAWRPSEAEVPLSKKNKSTYFGEF